MSKQLNMLKALGSKALVFKEYPRIVKLLRDLKEGTGAVTFNRGDIKAITLKTQINQIKDQTRKTALADNIDEFWHSILPRFSYNNRNIKFDVEHIDSNESFILIEKVNNEENMIKTVIDSNDSADDIVTKLISSIVSPISTQQVSKTVPGLLPEQ